ncbi:hypothetical protein D3C80_1669920 [compost metagenome]
MLFEPCHQLVDITDKFLGGAHFLQLSIISFICDITGIILNVDNHRIQLSLVEQGQQLFHSFAACTVSRDINAFNLGCIRLRIGMECAVRSSLCSAWSRGC